MIRTEAEAELLEIAGPAMGKVGLSVVPDDDGFIPSLNTALRAGFSAVGIRPAARAVADADFVNLLPEDEDRFLNVAKLSILDMVLFRWMKPNERENTTSQEWGNLYDSLAKRADSLRAIVGTYGIGMPTLGTGLIALGILEPCDEGEF